MFCKVRMLVATGCLWAATGATTAIAADPCGATGVLSHAGASVTCAYATQGTEDTFTVPAGISTLGVTAVGAPGGPGTSGVAGGLGALVSDASLPATPGAELWIDVGGAGATASCFTFNPGGFPDGGASPACSGGGGGSSALLTAPRASASVTGDVANDSRLLVAGGGGGTGQGFAGAAAGDPTVTGAGAGGCISNGGPGGIGPTDGTAGGGAGGCLGSNCAGGPGTATMGGVGASFCHFGAGGGGGWFGGGGGGGLVGGAGAGGAGGGGGSSYGGAGPSSGSTITTASSSQAPQVTITYTSTAAPDLARALTEDSTGKGPGKALANKAAAIEADVIGGQSAAACAEIADYLALVKAQAAKKLSPADATLLTTDAMKVAEALGC